MPQNSTSQKRLSWVEAWDKFWREVHPISSNGAQRQTDSQIMFNVIADQLQRSRLTATQVEDIRQLVQVAHLIGREEVVEKMAKVLGIPTDVKQCSECHGSGKTDDHVLGVRLCSTCQGTGEEVQKTCASCPHSVYEHGPGGCDKCACKSEVDV